MQRRSAEHELDPLSPEAIELYTQRGRQLRNEAIWDAAAALGRFVLRSIGKAKTLVFAFLFPSKLPHGPNPSGA